MQGSVHQSLHCASIVHRLMMNVICKVCMRHRIRRPRAMLAQHSKSGIKPALSTITRCQAFNKLHCCLLKATFTGAYAAWQVIEPCRVFLSLYCLGTVIGVLCLHSMSILMLWCDPIWLRGEVQRLQRNRVYDQKPYIPCAMCQAPDVPIEMKPVGLITALMARSNLKAGNPCHLDRVGRLLVLLCRLTVSS